jgi:hypothetical protein
MTAQDEAKQLDSVTDRVQEKELDEGRASQALGALNGSSSKHALDSQQIEVKKEDVDVIVEELEITEDEATVALRAVLVEDGSLEGQGLVAAALRRLVVS